MSAYIVNKAHFDALVRAGIATKAIDPLMVSGYGLTPTEFGRMLWAENVASVAHRYQGIAELPGPIPTPEPAAYEFVGSYKFPELSPVATLKAIAGYEYQSCENPGWEGSKARAFCERLRLETIPRLPGYREAAWEIDEVSR